MNVQHSIAFHVFCGSQNRRGVLFAKSLACRVRSAFAALIPLITVLALPLSAATPLRITSVTPRNGNVVVSWEGGTGPFQLLCRTNHTDDWRKIGQPTTATSVTNRAPAGSMCFFLVTTDVLAPAAPTGLRVITNGCGTAILNWSASTSDPGGSGFKGYNIYRNGGFVSQVPTNAISSLQDGMSPSTTYSFGVSAVDRVGNESTQALAVVTTVACANLRPVANAGTNQTSMAGVATTFDGSASHDQDGGIASYSWDFGDGTTGSGINPSHLYASSGTFTVTLTVTDNLGLTGTGTTVVTLNRPPLANAGADRTNGVGAPVAFDASASRDPDGTIASYYWRFGDGAVATGATASHVYTAVGTYPVTLLVRDNARTSARTTLQVTIISNSEQIIIISNQPPIADVGPARSGVVGTAVTFDGSRSWDPDGAIVSCAWMFGDGTVESGTNISVSHVYASAGTWMTTLMVMDNAGATATDTAVVTVAPAPNQLPIANAGPDKTGTVGTPVALSGAGSSDPDGTLITYTWTFGDGATGSAATVSHAYSSAGTYTARLTVTDNAGGTATDTSVVTVTAASGNQLPIAVAGPDQSGVVGAALLLSAAGSRDPDGTIASYVWTFSDGRSGCSTPYCYHSFASAGTYTATVTVTDNGGGRASATALVTITGTATTNQSPIANAGPDKSASVGASVSFSGSGSSDPDGSISSYAWTFGDGVTGSGVTASHAYASVGTFTARLTVTDNAGATASDTAIVTITTTPNQLPIANAGPDKSATVGASVLFSGSGSSDPDGTISSYAWTFGDGATGSGVAASHAYASVGTYTARITVTDNAGATASDTAVVTITTTPNQLPIANAGPDKGGTIGTSFTFSGAGSSDPDGSITSYAWTFGDGTTASGVTVSHAYASAGNYTAWLTVTDNSGATASDPAAVSISAATTNINQLPIANAGPDRSATVGTAASFSGAGSSDPDGSISSYAWTFGDGATGSGVSASHAYASAGTYTARLTVTDNSGATASDTAVVIVTTAGAPGQFVSAVTLGDVADDYGQAVAVDRSGNVLVAGYVTTITGAPHPFVGKRSPSGTLLWSNIFSGNAIGGVQAMATDAGDNVLVTGYFAGTLDLGGTSLTSANGSYDIFVAKLSNDGTHVWSKRFGSTIARNFGAELGSALAVDTNDNSVVITGCFEGTVDFGGGPMLPSSAQNLFLVKLSSHDGSFKWSRGVSSAANTSGNAVAIDASGNVFLTGSVVIFGGVSYTIDFGGGPIAPLGSEMFLAKYTAAGGYVWAKQFGASAVGSGLAVDRSGNVVVTGRYQLTINFGGQTLTNLISPFGWPNSQFVANFSTANGGHIWSKRLNGGSGSGVAVGPSGNITIISALPYVVNLAADGTERWSKTFLGDSPCTSVATDANGHSYVVGKFFNTVDFGVGPITTTGRADIFLVELGL